VLPVIVKLVNTTANYVIASHGHQACLLLVIDDVYIAPVFCGFFHCVRFAHGVFFAAD